MEDVAFNRGKDARRSSLSTPKLSFGSVRVERSGSAGVGDPDHERLRQGTLAGWDVERQYANALVTGIFIPGEGAATHAIRAAFTAAGIPFSTETLPNPGMSYGSPGQTDAVLFVGSKPRPN